MRYISNMRTSRKVLYPLIAFAPIIILLFSISMTAAAEESTPEVLILDSYHQGEDWSDNEIDGIRVAFNEVYPFFIPSIEHMDTKRFPNPNHLLFIKNYLKSKYLGKQFDIIMTLDNSALNLMLQYGDELFPEVPIVFAGVNGYHPDMLEGRTNITGVAEDQDMEGTLRLAIKINPEIKTVLAVHDYTESGFAVRRDMETVAEKSINQVTVEYTPEGTIDELLLQLKALPRYTNVLLLTYFTDKNGRTLTREESTRLITTASPVPVYAMHETRLGHGIVGGMLLEGREHGRQAAAQALRILAGEEISQVPVENSRSRPVFDLNVLNRFNISEKILPTDSVIINRPASFWRQYRTIWVPGVIIIVILVISTALLIKTIIRMHIAEKSLRDAIQLNKEIIDSAQEGVIVYDLDLRYRVWNPFMEKLSGVSAKNVLGLQPLEVFPFHKETQLMKVLERALDGETPEPIDFQFSVPDSGLSGWTSDQSGPLRNANGEIIGVIATVRDITERLQAEEALKESEAKYRHMMESMDDASYICSKDFRVEYMNAAMIKRIGRDATGEICYEVMHGLDEKCPWCAHEKVMQGKSIKAEVLSPIDNRTFHVSNSPISHSPGSISKLTVFRDITETRKIEERLQQAQKMESIGNLAGGIAHDFNNLLYPIIGMSELLLEDLTPGSREYENAQEILEAGMRGGDLVKQILAFSRQSEHKKMPVRIQQVLTEVLKLCRATIPSNIEITQNIQKDCGRAMADATQLHQIVMNLVTNAYHAVEKNNGKISVVLKEVKPEMAHFSDQMLNPGRYALLSISDTGMGIPEEVMNKIFEPYFTTKEKGKGTGLGLAVVYGIVKEYNGDIKVYSEPGRGTTFDVYLPLMEDSIQTTVVDKTATFETGTERILLVDDEVPVARLEKQTLERLGYKVAERTSSKDALEAFRANPSSYDLVITDMSMPYMTGFQLAQEILKIKEDMPIIICTGYSERINKESISASGITGFLMKPVIKADMARMVRKILDEATASA